MNKAKQHVFNGKLLSWQYCTKCGLISLKNEPTRKAMRAACPGSDEE